MSIIIIGTPIDRYTSLENGDAKTIKFLSSYLLPFESKIGVFWEVGKVKSVKFPWSVW